MNDYKELIENLRSNINNVFQQQAADAIEQLVRERNAAVKDLFEELILAFTAKRMPTAFLIVIMRCGNGEVCRNEIRET